MIGPARPFAPSATYLGDRGYQKRQPMSVRSRVIAVQPSVEWAAREATGMDDSQSARDLSGAP